MQSCHHILYERLNPLGSSLMHCSETARVTHEFQVMVLDVNVDTVMRFAGKRGEAEAHHAYQDLQVWSKGKSARIAIWHAAQETRAARAVLPFRIRGADAFMTYHAVIMLWSYGTMPRGAARRTGTDPPVRASVTGNADIPQTTTRTSFASTMLTMHKLTSFSARGRVNLVCARSSPRSASSASHLWSHHSVASR